MQENEIQGNLGNENDQDKKMKFKGTWRNDNGNIGNEINKMKFKGTWRNDNDNGNGNKDNKMKFKETWRKAKNNSVVHVLHMDNEYKKIK